MPPTVKDSAQESRTDVTTMMKPPVFVVGCPRSGTTVLYHMLLSAGGFAIYRAESNVFNLLVPRFGSLRSVSNRQRLMDCWLKSKLFRVTGLDAKEIKAKIIEECRSGGDFLRLVMEETARKQGMDRWADCTPDHLLHLPEIAAQLPDAYVIHIIRDGRDVALSYVKQSWAYPLPWDRHEHLSVAGLYWEWSVRKGRGYGRRLGDRYQEVRFEDLVQSPRATLAQLGRFIGHDLNYDRIQQAGIGSVREPNTSFQNEETGFNPVGRWKEKMSPEKTVELENLIGRFLLELGYPLAAQPLRVYSVHTRRLRATYLTMFETKKWLKNKTPLGRLVRLGRMQIEPSPGSA